MSDRSKQLELSKKAAERAKDFKPAVFNARLKNFLVRGTESYVFNRFVEEAVPVLRTLTSEAITSNVANLHTLHKFKLNAAAIIEPNIHTTFELSVRSVVGIKNCMIRSSKAEFCKIILFTIIKIDVSPWIFMAHFCFPL